MRKHTIFYTLAGIIVLLLMITSGGIWAFNISKRSMRLIEFGDDFFWRSQFTDAEDAYIDAHERAFNSEQAAAAYTRLCRLYEYNLELNRAMETCQTALQLSPVNADAEARMGRIFRRMGDLDEASAHGHRALQIDSANMCAAAFLAVTLAEQGSSNHSDYISKADKLIELAISAERTDPEIYQSAGSIKQLQGELDPAANFFLDAVTLAPDFAPYYLDLGETRREQGLVIEALEAYNSALELNPELVQGYQGRGWILWSTGNFEWAQRDFQKAILLDEKNAESWAGLGWAQLNSGANEEAELAFQLALSLDAENESAKTGEAVLNTQLMAVDLAQNNVNIQAENATDDGAKPRIDYAIPAAVQVFAFNEGMEISNTCSGVVIAANGMLLTSAHCMVDPANGQPFNRLNLAGIGVVEDTSMPPEKKYRAKASEIDISRDIAVLQIVEDWAGNPVTTTLDLPFMIIGDSNSLHAGDEVWTIGFPGMGGSTLTITQGVVSGFVERDGLMWVKTDLMTGSGSSGGMVLNSVGELVGIHVQSWSDQSTPTSRLSIECPINSARTLFE